MVTDNMTVENWTSVVERKLRELDDLAKELYPTVRFAPYQVEYRLRGKAAGQVHSWINNFTSQPERFVFKFNKYFALNWPKEFEDTVIHEYAHYVADVVHNRNTHHSIEWRRIALDLGGSGETYHTFSPETKIRKSIKGQYNLPKPMEREEARGKGLTLYWNGTPCEAGHRAPRYVRDNACKECYRIKRSGNDQIQLMG